MYHFVYRHIQGNVCYFINETFTLTNLYLAKNTETL